MKRTIAIYFLVAFLVSGVTAQINEITLEAYRKVEDSAANLLKESNYRLERKVEIFETPGTDAKLVETFIKEVILPNRWRTVEFTNRGSRTITEESLFDGNALFVRRDVGEWQKFSGGQSGSGRSESGRITTTYRYLGKSDLNGVETDLYELESLRVANKFTVNSIVVVRYNKKIRSWYSSDGRSLKVIEENSIEGQNGLSRSTTVIEYDPDIKIEAPIK